MADTNTWGIYHADDGTLYRYRRKDFYFAYPSSWGWYATSDLSIPLIPPWLKMRYVICYQPPLHRVIPVARRDVYGWTVRDGSLNVVLPKADGTFGSGWLVKSWFDEVRLKHS